MDCNHFSFFHNGGTRSEPDSSRSPLSRAVEAPIGPETAEPDRMLVAACLQGDENAWDQLVDKYGGLVYWIACRKTPSRDKADKVFLRVFEVLLHSLPELRQEHSLARWLTRITEREAQR